MRNPQQFNNKKILIYGFGRSGRALFDLLKEHASTISITADRPVDFSDSPAYAPYFLDVAEATQQITNEKFHVLALSPGVPPNANLIKLAKELPIPVIGEFEIAWHFSKGKMLTTTGTNGKTTTVTLLKSILEAQFGEEKTHLAGNMGVPFSETATLTEDDHVTVLEMSSFQAWATKDFSPDVLTLLNLTPDHLNWHGSFTNYAEAKFSPIPRMSKDSLLISNLDDQAIAKHLPQTVCALLYFTLGENPNAQCRKHGDFLQFSNGIKIALADIVLPGEHNHQNVMAAVESALKIGVTEAVIRQVLATFKGVEHRFEPVAVINNVEFINDSKATNVASTLTAIRCLKKPTHLILGGSPKGEDYSLLRAAVSVSPVTTVYLMGTTADEIESVLTGVCTLFKIPDLATGVQQAFANSQPGEMIVLSPACASYDAFANFEARGRYFKEVVTNLTNSSL